MPTQKLISFSSAESIATVDPFPLVPAIEMTYSNFLRFNLLRTASTRSRPRLISIEDNVSNLTSQSSKESKVLEFFKITLVPLSYEI